MLKNKYIISFCFPFFTLYLNAGYEENLIALYREAKLDSGFKVIEVGKATLLISPVKDDPLFNQVVGEITEEAIDRMEEQIPSYVFEICIDSKRKDLEQLLIKKGYYCQSKLAEMAANIEFYKKKIFDNHISIVSVDSDKRWKEWLAVIGEVYEEKNPEIFEEPLRSSSITRYLAYYDKEPAGAVLLFVNDKAVGISSLGVKTTFRGRHIGTALLQECVLKAQEKGFKSLIDLSSQMGKTFYEKLGCA